MGHFRKACRKLGITVPSPSAGILLSGYAGVRGRGELVYMYTINACTCIYVGELTGCRNA